MCFVCGKDNPRGFRLSFKHPEKGRLISEVTFKKEHQGYKDIVHGGMIAMLLDEMMVNLAWLEGTPAVTGELTVRLKRAVKVGERVLLEGRIESGKGRLLFARAEAKNARGELLASAMATCVQIKS